MESGALNRAPDAVAAATANHGDSGVATVESLNHDGRGVARIDGKVIFIEGALPGETVRFRYFNKYPSFDTGGTLEVLHASPDRVTPPCPHFGVCGGCSMQHLAPPAQVRAKQRVLADNLEHIGRVTPEQWLAPLTGSDRHYRRRARLGVRHVPTRGGILIGFRERRRSYITPLQSCHVLDRQASELLPELKRLITGLSRPNRVPQIEVAAADNALVLVFRHLVPLTEADRERLRDFARSHGVQVQLQGRGPDSIETLEPARPEPQHYALPEFDVRFEFRATDFIQINDAMNRQVAHQVATLLEPGPDDRVLDLFCGLGNFTLPLARRCAQVLGIEGEEELVAAARHNAALNDIHNAKFRGADLFDESGPSPWAGFAFDRLLLDPPRGGAIEAVKRLGENPPARVVYVSCNPATLARDSGYLVNALGYRLAAAGVMDMFPHTSHVESVALFLRS
jgi:23S rRNA (uracil1939-C5)-methyltransferase